MRVITVALVRLHVLLVPPVVIPLRVALTHAPCVGRGSSLPIRVRQCAVSVTLGRLNILPVRFTVRRVTKDFSLMVPVIITA